MSTTEQRVAKPTYTLEEAAAALAEVGPLLYWVELSPVVAPRGNRVELLAAIGAGKGTMVAHAESVMIDDRNPWLGEYALGRARHRLVQWVKAAIA